MVIYMKGGQMENDYADFALLFKALADETRLKIVDMLSCGELCACDILKYFNITQPTLSYHMKILTDCEIVHADRQGAWMHYTLNDETVKKVSAYWGRITNDKKDCICDRYKKKNDQTCSCKKQLCNDKKEI